VTDLSADEQGAILGYDGPERTLLVVDDIPVNRELLHDLCAGWGFRVILAANGNEALANWVTHGLSGIDAVLVDQFMPNGSGWDLLLAIRNLPGPEQRPVILVSAAPPEPPPDFPPDLRFDGVLLKPDVAKPLAGLLESLLGLSWRRQELVPKAEFSIARLPAERIGEFKSMVELGRIVALEHWAEALGLNHPEWADLAVEIKRLAESANLGGLQRLLDGPLPPVAANGSPSHGPC
jgi:CheY-like chemotaxis protein